MRKKIHRFFTAVPFTNSEVTISDPELIHQWSRVLRLTTGETIILVNPEGFEAEGVLQELTPHNATVKITSVKKKEEQGRKVTLYAAILKGDHFELALEKAVEAGVSSIVPILTERTVKTGLKQERLLKIIREAAEQSGRSFIPALKEAIPFTEALSKAKATDTVVFCDPDGTYYREVFPGLPSSVSLFIGPEGGWSEAETNLAKDSGALCTSLGNLILRGETAVTIATFLTVHTK